MKRTIHLIVLLMATLLIGHKANSQNMFIKEWKTVDSLEQKGLYGSALEEVSKLFDKAVAENDVNHTVKALMYRLKHNQNITEDDYVIAINQLDALVLTVDNPVKPIIHSLLAEIYFGYYAQNIWKFSDRTAVESEVELKDIRTWDIERLATKIIHHYQTSISEPEVISGYALKPLETIIYIPFNEGVDHYTLYDLLADRAFNFFSQNTFNIGGSAKTFTLNDPVIFKTDLGFTDMPVNSPDSFNLTFYAVKTLQNMTAITTAKHNPHAVLQLKVKRLKFAKQHSILPNANDLYLKAIKKLTLDYKDYPFVGEAWYELATELYNTGHDYQPGNADDQKRWQAKQAVTICNEVVKSYPNSLGARQCEGLLARIRSKSLSLTVENTYIPQTNNTVLVQFKNINQVYYKIVSAKKNSYKNQEDLKAYLQKEPDVYQNTVPLKNPGDYHNHSTELLLPKLDCGDYFIAVSDSADFNGEKQGFTYAHFTVTSLTYQTKTKSDEIELVALCRKTGHPIEGATVKAKTKSYNYKLNRYVEKNEGTYTTDKNGKVIITKLSPNQSYYFSLKSGDDFYDPDQNIYFYSREVNPQKQVKVNLFTDRKLYRPGQTIYFKGIVLEHLQDQNDLKPNYSTTVEFLDVNSEKIASVEVTTNEYGSFSGQFVAPYGVLTGSMTIRTQYSSTTVQVEEYKRPKFSAEINAIDGEYQLNDSVPVNGSALAFAGNAISGAKVVYRVMRSVRYNNWYWWYRPSVTTEITNGETTTDSEGKFSFNFKAIPDETRDPKQLPLFDYSITVDVIDINGESHSASKTFTLGYQSVILSNSLKSSVNKQSALKFEINALGLNGNPIHSKGNLKIHKLKSPERTLTARLWSSPDLPQWSKQKFNELFPNKLYDKENDKTSWAIEKTVANQAFDTETLSTIAFDDLKKWPVGQYRYVAQTKDKDGVLVEDIHYFTVFDPESKVPATNEVFDIRLLKTSVQPGEDLEVLISTAEEHLNVRYNIVHKGEAKQEQWVHLKQEQKRIKIPVTTDHIGGFTIDFIVIKNNRSYSVRKHITVPKPDTDLKISFETFRNKLLPGQEETWTLVIKNANDEQTQAELLATLYDASLDELFTPNSFNLQLGSARYPNYFWTKAGGIGTSHRQNINYHWNKTKTIPSRNYPHLNYFGYYPRQWFFSGRRLFSKMEAGNISDMYMNESSVVEDEEESFGLAVGAGAGTGVSSYKAHADGVLGLNKKGDKATLIDTSDKVEAGKQNGSPASQPRTNFNETAFFHPQLHTNNKGEIRIEFTMPESLTKWRFIGLAHSKTLEIGQIEKELVTQKDLMVMPNVPRFLREGDDIEISSKISNLSDKLLSGTITLTLFDPLTETNITNAFDPSELSQSFNVDSKGNMQVSWKIKVPVKYSAVKYRIMAETPEHNDGEENVLPVLSNRMLVTESMPIPVNGTGSKTFKFDKLLNTNSTTLQHHNLSLEFTSNPAWYALQAMPYMMEYPHECAEQTFTRYYSNAIATHVLNSKPRIKQVIESWKSDSPDAFLSNLNKNQELKAVLLEETPWVINAKSESETKKNLAVLLDLKRMQQELDRALNTTIKNQSPNGGWSWFPGMRTNRYITQHIITGLGHLDVLGISSIKNDKKVRKMVKKGVNFLDKTIVSDFLRIQKLHPEYQKENHLSYIQIQYLYARSYFQDLKPDQATQQAIDYFTNQAKEYWTGFNIYAQGMIGLAAHRFGISELSSDIYKSLKDNAILHDEFGMYWKSYHVGFYWYEAPVETQALMIEFFNEMQDKESVEQLKAWLLKEKQTTHWKTTKQTSEAVYALLLNGVDLLASEDLVTITIGGKNLEYVSEPSTNPYQVKPEAGTGYVKTNWEGDQIKPEMGKVKITKTNPGVAWGALYWQYFENLDKISFHETPLKLNKNLYAVKLTDRGEQLVAIAEDNPLEVGDKVRVRIELRTDRNLEYVHMKDMRAAGFEPVNVISSYKYQGGLGYYQATKDAATNFFFDYIPKGTYVFEYDLSVQQKGNFSNGLATIQCMYAPEFTSHSEGVRVVVK